VIVGLAGLDGWLLATAHLTGAFDRMLGDPVMFMAGAGLLIGATLFHECGHATACKYGGARPGAIGAGIYLAFPAFYTNVTDSYRLDRRGRLRTDLGGVYFNAVFILGLGAIYALTGYAPLLVIIVLTHIEMLEQLMPFVRLDGYYVLADLVGVPDLFARIRPVVRSFFRRNAFDHRVAELTRRTRAIVTAWVVVTVPLLMASLVLLLIHLPEFLRKTWSTEVADWNAIGPAAHTAHIASTALAGMSMVIVAIPAAGLGILLARGLNQARRLLWPRRGAHFSWFRPRWSFRRTPALPPSTVSTGKRSARGVAAGTRLCTSGLLSALLFTPLFIPGAHSLTAAPPTTGWSPWPNDRARPSPNWAGNALTYAATMWWQSTGR
jgi:putative peptide zinc metalloprotease protein